MDLLLQNSYQTRLVLGSKIPNLFSTARDSLVTQDWLPWFSAFQQVSAVTALAFPHERRMIAPPPIQAPNLLLPYGDTRYRPPPPPGLPQGGIRVLLRSG